MVEVVRAIAPDAIVLSAVDWDLDGHTLKALANAIGGFEHSFTSRPIRDIQSGRDLNGDGRLGTPHLVGHDHHREREALAMRAKERELWRAARGARK